MAFPPRPTPEPAEDHFLFDPKCKDCQRFGAPCRWQCVACKAHNPMERPRCMVCGAAK